MHTTISYLKNRANEAKAYLVGKGITTERIVAKGYGEKVPLAPNEKDGKDDRKDVQETDVLNSKFYQINLKKLPKFSTTQLNLFRKLKQVPVSINN